VHTSRKDEERNGDDCTSFKKRASSKTGKGKTEFFRSGLKKEL